jgi:hypothetical protein
VDRAPLPPHERPWRHPSELGPPAPEPTSTSGRVIIATAATLSLLLIGLLAISMTPDQGGTPRAVASTTSGSHGSAVALEQPRVPLVTPIGDDGWALATSGAVKASTGVMSARLPTGDVVDVRIVRRDDDAGLTLVSLPSQTSGYRLAASPPAPTDTVEVHSSRRTQVVEMVALSTLDVEEGAAVVDDDGDLVGLCTMDSGTVEVLTISTMPGTTSPPSTTTTTTPRRQTTTVPTTVSTTVAVPAPSTTPSSAPAPTNPATSIPAPTSSGVTSDGADATPGSS